MLHKRKNFWADIRSIISIIRIVAYTKIYSIGFSFSFCLRQISTSTKPFCNHEIDFGSTRERVCMSLVAIFFFFGPIQHSWIWSDEAYRLSYRIASHRFYCNEMQSHCHNKLFICCKNCKTMLFERLKDDHPISMHNDSFRFLFTLRYERNDEEAVFLSCSFVESIKRRMWNEETTFYRYDYFLFSFRLVSFLQLLETNNLFRPFWSSSHQITWPNFYCYWP